MPKQVICNIMGCWNKCGKRWNICKDHAEKLYGEEDYA